MNALVAIHRTGLHTPSPTEKAEVRRELSATRAADVLGRMVPAKAMAVTKQQAEAAQGPQELGTDAFLQLLVAQMQNQDPLEPMENTEMLAQLAQFTTVEQITQVSQGFDELQTDIERLNFVSASSLVGRIINGLDDQGNFVEGVVDSVVMGEDGIILNVGGAAVTLDRLIGFGDSAPAGT
jgi:flagellar basal-body rod modification protein FlgD